MDDYRARLVSMAYELGCNQVTITDHGVEFTQNRNGYSADRMNVTDLRGCGDVRVEFRRGESFVELHHNPRLVGPE